MKKILNIAHRGASGHCPENTIQAFQKAIQLGADFIELDVQKTADEKIVVYHDAEFKGGLSLKYLSCAEVKKEGLDRGVKIPLLSEVFDDVADRIGINIEVKGVDVVDLLLGELEKYNTENVIVSSFMHDLLKGITIEAPDLKVGVLLENSLYNALQVLGKVGADLLIQRFEYIDVEYVRMLHENNKQIFAWTLNDEKDIKRMINLGVDGIFSDYPDRVSKLLKEKKE